MNVCMLRKEKKGVYVAALSYHKKRWYSLGKKYDPWMAEEIERKEQKNVSVMFSLGLGENEELLNENEWVLCSFSLLL